MTDWVSEIGKVYQYDGRNYFIDVPLDELLDAVARMRKKGVLRVSAITGQQTGDSLEMIYHFVHKGETLSLRVKLGSGRAALPTITKVFPAAVLLEREAGEMTGVKIKGNEKGMLLAADSPRAPLRKKR